MKNLVYFLVFALIFNFSFAQKKKTTVKKATTEKKSLVKADNLIAEVKGNTFQVTITEKGKPTDALIVKELNESSKPMDIKLASFTASGKKLYLLQWMEKSNTKTEVKTEDISIIYSVIYEMTTKKQVFSNFEKINNIVEKVFLDKNKNASETQEKIRREGFVFILNLDGTIAQKNKTQENKWVYDVVKMEFVGKK